ncbi:MAG: 30S ribosome-binding factor RbfA [Phycisphaerae bacterium]|nr:30S ribosome-binding factor RbfA [Phycisphaerae bacterium]NUQ49544.1 30S ribosome-binding factor RbfA [Phycisphaerae bacterium]
MGHRLERLGSVIRGVVSDAILSRVSDPRVSRLTSITRVNVSADLKFADVYFSVMGSEVEGRTTLRGLQSARGMIQSLLARDLTIRQCPLLRFHLDDSIKKGIETVRALDKLAAERKQRAAPDAEPPADAPPDGGAE